MEATREVRLDVVDCDLAPSRAEPSLPAPEDTCPPAAVAPIPGEVWRALDSHPRYLVSSFGRVAHQTRGLARPWQKPDQAVVYVSIGGHNVVVHKLVAAAFLGPKPAGHRLGWRDGDRAHCALWNLEWVPLKVVPRAPRHPACAPRRGRLLALLATMFVHGVPDRVDRCPRCGTLVEQEPGFMRCRLGCGRLWPLLRVPVLVQRFYEYRAGLRAGPDVVARPPTMLGRRG